MNKRKHERRVRALARYPKTFQSRKGKRTEAEWNAERVRLELFIATRARA
jgi:hypothetical protein